MTAETSSIRPASIMVYFVMGPHSSLYTKVSDGRIFFVWTSLYSSARRRASSIDACVCQCS